MREDEQSMAESVVKALSDLSSRLDVHSLQIYLEELFCWNPTLGLISKREPERTAAKLVRLSVDLWDFAAGACGLSSTSARLRFVEIGSGGGFPGIVWKLVVPELEALLVERKERRAVFLERLVRRLALSNLEVIQGDAEVLAKDEAYREAFDMVVMLAVAPPEQMVSTIEALLRRPGYFCTVRGGAEKIIEDSLGRTLRLRRALAGEEGVFVLYEN